MPASGRTSRGRPTSSQYAKPAGTRGRSRTKSTPPNQGASTSDDHDTQSQQDTPTTDDQIAARIESKIDTMLSAAIDKAVPQLAARLGQLAGSATPNTNAPAEPDPAKVTKPKPTKSKAKRTRKSPEPTDGSDSDTSSDKPDPKPSRKKRKRSKSSKQKKRKRATSETSDTEESSGKSSSESEDEDDDDLPSEEEGTPSRPSFGYKIGETVSKKLRKKILNNQFVELIELLPQSEANKSLVLTTSDSNSVKLARKTTTTKHITLDQWNERHSSFTWQRTWTQLKQPRKKGP